MGVGGHTGVAYIGTMAGADNSIMDVRALGDSVNTAVRLCSMAAPGEAFLTESACAHAGLDLNVLEQRQMELKGKRESVNVRVLHADSLVTVPDIARLI
jgi:adenylate cyclase